MLFNSDHIISHHIQQHLWDISPIELKVFITLLLLTQFSEGEIIISAYRLSQKANLYTKDVIDVLKKLEKRELIQLELATIPTEDSFIRIIDCETNKNSDSEPVYEHNAREDLESVICPNNIYEKTELKNTEKIRYNVNNDNVNNNDVKNNVIKNVNGKPVDNSYAQKQNEFEPKTKETNMAVHISKSLNDEKNLGLYVNYCKNYPVNLIFKAFGLVKETPDDKIKKSRGALFTYLVKTLAKQMGIKKKK